MSSNNGYQKQTVFKEDGNGKSSTGLNENLAGLLCYLVGFITGIIFLLIEKESRFVRFHAMQSIATFVAFFILGTALSFIPVLGIIISLLLSPLGFILWLFMMYKAYKGEYFKLPIVGDFAEKQV